jgi:hypothetical protein
VDIQLVPKGQTNVVTWFHGLSASVRGGDVPSPEASPQVVPVVREAWLNQFLLDLAFL